MKKAVLASIKPCHTARIKAGEKDIEVRKTRPSIADPFKVYVYETKDGGTGAGAVVCEFVFDWFCIMPDPMDGSIRKEFCQGACLTEQEIRDYAKGRDVYGWHISELIVYETPKALSDFTPLCRFLLDGGECDHGKVACPYQDFDYNPWPDYSVNVVTCRKRMAKPPQSWCYVEEV